ncbi:hypothetical protein JTB14_010305 [Gonioctena quinquepunctata]|nr:hypothetical protein JTB14_010305 [Gonioctena quinquepunctata]
MVHVPKANRTKWQKKSKRTILIGFGGNTKGYRVYDPEVGSVSTSRDVVIIEKAEEVPITINSEPVGDNDTTEVIISEDTDTGSESEYSSVRNDEEEIQTSDTEFLPEITLRDQTNDETIEAIRRSSRVPKPKSFEDFVTYNCMSGDVDVDPANVDEALSGPEKEQWRQAMKEEYQSFIDNEAWEITEVPDGANVVDCKWVYKKKKNIDGSVRINMNIQKFINLRAPTALLFQKRGFKHYPPPPNYDGVEFPERPKLRVVERAPQLPQAIRPPKMQKKLRLMRGPEPIHNFLLHKQYGIMALGGGRLKWGHFEMMRYTVGRKIDTNRMFALWRVDSPWQPLTKQGQGQRMGGGKGAIDHYVTPVKAGRIILEVGGKCEFKEVKDFLEDIAMKLPFKAMAVSQDLLEEMKKREKWEEENNQNPWTMKYVIQNNMGGCYRWLSPIDMKYFGKYV